MKKEVAEKCLLVVSSPVKRKKKTIYSIYVCICMRIETCGRTHKAVNLVISSEIAGGEERNFLLYPLDFNL